MQTGLARALLRKGWWIVPVIGVMILASPRAATVPAGPDGTHGVRVTRGQSAAQPVEAAVLDYARLAVPARWMPGARDAGSRVRVTRHH